MNNTSDDASARSLEASEDERSFEKVLGFNSSDGWVEYASMARNYLNLSRTGSLRLVVLETWLFLDYTIKQLLMVALGIPSVDSDALDLRQDLLPNFLRCLNLVIRIRDMNCELDKPFPRITMPGRVLFYLQKDEPTLFDQLIKAERRFLESIGAPQVGVSGASTVLTTKDPKPRWVPDGWLEMTSRIDKTWKARAEQLDRARNKAAHSYDELAIVAKLGFTGPNALELAKADCRTMAKELVDVSDDSTWIDKWLNLSKGATDD